MLLWSSSITCFVMFEVVLLFTWVCFEVVWGLFWYVFRFCSQCAWILYWFHWFFENVWYRGVIVWMLLVYGVLTSCCAELGVVFIQWYYCFELLVILIRYCFLSISTLLHFRFYVYHDNILLVSQYCVDLVLFVLCNHIVSM